jgi:hypothetical protein
MGKDSNLRSQRQQVYSLPVLTTYLPIQKDRRWIFYAKAYDDPVIIGPSYNVSKKKRAVA